MGISDETAGAGGKPVGPAPPDGQREEELSDEGGSGRKRGRRRTLLARDLKTVELTFNEYRHLKVTQTAATVLNSVATGFLFLAIEALIGGPLQTVTAEPLPKYLPWIFLVVAGGLYVAGHFARLNNHAEAEVIDVEHGLKQPNPS